MGRLFLLFLLTNMPCWYPRGRRVRGSLTREAPDKRGLASRQGLLILIVPEGAAVLTAEITTGLVCRTTVARRTGQYRCGLYADNFYFRILICLFHTLFPPFSLLNYDFLTIHDVETLRGLADALTLQVAITLIF